MELPVRLRRVELPVRLRKPRDRAGAREPDQMFRADVRREDRRAYREPSDAAPAEEKVLARLYLVAPQREDDHSGQHAEIAEYHKPVNPRQHLFCAPFPCLQKKYSKTAAMQPSPKRVTIGKSPAESLSRGGKPGRITSHGGASGSTDNPSHWTSSRTRCTCCRPVHASESDSGHTSTNRHCLQVHEVVHPHR